ncbi:MBL fold metallo-hydrolase [Dactylosporangium sp. NPDC049140]|uniref:MBL fold metallo-hydrolase n=1 Tax=Dactylosporangium sp. NPDC049140 TaxID=3155647 RepID=UPI0033F6E3E1
MDAWLVTDERSELRAKLRRLAAEHEVTPAMAGHTAGALCVQPQPVTHTSHPTFGYAIRAGNRLVVWAPEFWQFPAWAAGADLMFAEAAAWDRPIRFRGGVGGHASLHSTAEQAEQLGVRRLVYAHIGRPVIRAMDAGLQPPMGEWGIEGHTYQLPVQGPGPGRLA